MFKVWTLYNGFSNVNRFDIDLNEDDDEGGDECMLSDKYVWADEMKRSLLLLLTNELIKRFDFRGELFMDLDVK